VVGFLFYTGEKNLDEKTQFWLQRWQIAWFFILEGEKNLTCVE